jgi:amidase
MQGGKRPLARATGARPAGGHNQIFSPATGFPAITVPMGVRRGNRLPAGLQLFGRPWSEGELFRLAYS